MFSLGNCILLSAALFAIGAYGVLARRNLLVVLMSRRQGKTDTKIAEVVADMNERMEAMLGELSSALERAEEESRRNRTFGELAGSIDLDEVLSRTLEAGGAVPGVDAALVSISNDGEKPIVATLGLSAEEAQRQVVSGPPDGHEARAISLVYQYPPTLAESSRTVFSTRARDL